MNLLKNLAKGFMIATAAVCTVAIVVAVVLIPIWTFDKFSDTPFLAAGLAFIVVGLELGLACVLDDWINS